jgi:hypothetical protein
VAPAAMVPVEPIQKVLDLVDTSHFRWTRCNICSEPVAALVPMVEQLPIRLLRRVSRMARQQVAATNTSGANGSVQVRYGSHWGCNCNHMQGEHGGSSLQAIQELVGGGGAGNASSRSANATWDSRRDWRAILVEVEHGGSGGAGIIQLQTEDPQAVVAVVPTRIR